MNHLMRYKGYSTKERSDDILDKISKYGISSITKLEKEFLDSYASGEENEVAIKVAKEENEVVFEDEYFKFELDNIMEYKDETHYMGTIYVPDLKLKNNKKIGGRLNGKIISSNDGIISLDFYLDKKRNNHDIFEFCEGLEYELDNFIDYITHELKHNNEL